MSNLSIYQVKQQYLENKELWDNQPYSVHDFHEDQAAEGGLAESDPLVAEIAFETDDENDDDVTSKN